jgi:hypothetical protein
MPGLQTAVEDNLHSERGEVDVPGFDQRVQEREAVVVRDIQEVRFEELDHDDAHLFVTATREPGHPTEPVLVAQFLPGHPLHHVQQLLGHETLDRAERLLREHRAQRGCLAGIALAENQLADGLEKRSWRIGQLPLQGIAALHVRQSG